MNPQSRAGLVTWLLNNRLVILLALFAAEVLSQPQVTRAAEAVRTAPDIELLGLYNAAYIADDSAVLAVAVVSLSHRKLQEGGGRWLKLVSGIVMVALGGALLVRPAWLAGPLGHS